MVRRSHRSSEIDFLTVVRVAGSSQSFTTKSLTSGQRGSRKLLPEPKRSHKLSTRGEPTNEKTSTLVCAPGPGIRNLLLRPAAGDRVAFAISCAQAKTDQSAITEETVRQ